MSIKVFRVKIEGYVVSHSFGGPSPELTPVDWGVEVIVKEMGADIEVTEILLDEIEDQEGE